MRYARGMRLLLPALVILLAGCPVDGDECAVDEECDTGFVCARDKACTAAAEVREVKTTWTINGAAASMAACGERDLYIEFFGRSREDRVRFEPVPCPIGQFVVDKLPLRFGSVELGDLFGGDSQVSAFDDTGNASIDLRF